MNSRPAGGVGVVGVPAPLPAGGGTSGGVVPVPAPLAVAGGGVVAGVQFLSEAAVAVGVAAGAGAGAGRGGGAVSSSCTGPGVAVMFVVTVPVVVPQGFLVSVRAFFASAPSSISDSSALAAVDARLVPAAPQPAGRVNMYAKLESQITLVASCM